VRAQRRSKYSGVCLRLCGELRGPGNKTFRDQETRLGQWQRVPRARIEPCASLTHSLRHVCHGVHLSLPLPHRSILQPCSRALCPWWCIQCLPGFHFSIIAFDTFTAPNTNVFRILMLQIYKSLSTRLFWGAYGFKLASAIC